MYTFNANEKVIDYMIDDSKKPLMKLFLILQMNYLQNHQMRGKCKRLAGSMSPH